MSKSITKQHVEAAIACFPTLKAFAEALSTPERPITYQVVQQWRENGVPVEHCAKVEEVTCNKVTRPQLRPHDWQTIWPELTHSA